MDKTKQPSRRGWKRKWWKILLGVVGLTTLGGGIATVSVACDRGNAANNASTNQSALVVKPPKK